jgi:hypothetical protein
VLVDHLVALALLGVEGHAVAVAVAATLGDEQPEPGGGSVLLT